MTINPTFDCSNQLCEENGAVWVNGEVLTSKSWQYYWKIYKNATGLGHCMSMRPIYSSSIQFQQQHCYLERPFFCQSICRTCKNILKGISLLHAEASSLVLQRGGTRNKSQLILLYIFKSR